ncbi:hypothetical protein [Streptomyces johnsoniae]|uniref:SpdD protein n=1 Tax=Streptomyces johnsoniae TaxID=3075532 RepID=A0ABU2SAF9_9ACTN|nr:hypothetical protein [Streptomyces sp. DSM 41886]MDT0445961.1 hypothetical protein [Streptomyces sp. DSM 41886]
MNPQHAHHGACGCYTPPPSPPSGCQHLTAPQYAPAPAPAVQPDRTVQIAKWAAAGGAASLFLLAFALAAIAIAVGAVAVTICVLVLRGLWNDMTKENR